MSRASIKQDLDAKIKSGLANGVQAADHNSIDKAIVDNAFSLADDTAENITEGTTHKFATRDNVFALIKTNSAITKDGNQIAFDFSTSGNTTSYDDGSIDLTFGTVTSQPHLKLRTATETNGNAIDIPSGVEHGASEGGLLIRSGDFYTEVPFSDLLEIPVDATNDTVVDTSGNTQNAILHRSASVGNGYESIYVGTTSTDKLLVLATSNDGTNTTDVTSSIKVWILEHAHRGTFHANDPAETAIADADKIGFFDDSESFQPPKTITFANFKTALNIPASGSGSGLPSEVVSLTPSANVAMVAAHAGKYIAMAPTADVRYTFNASLGANGDLVIISNQTGTAGNDVAVYGGVGNTHLLRTLTQSQSYPFLKINNVWVEMFDVEAGGGETPQPTQPTLSERAYWGGTNDNTSFSTYTPTADNIAGRWHDARTSSASFSVTLPIPASGYGYIMLPNSRPMTSAINPLGADRISGFTRTEDAFQVLGVDYDVWQLTQQNLLSEQADLDFTITLGGTA